MDSSNRVQTLQVLAPDDGFIAITLGALADGIRELNGTHVAAWVSSDREHNQLGKSFSVTGHLDSRTIRHKHDAKGLISMN